MTDELDELTKIKKAVTGLQQSHTFLMDVVEAVEVEAKNYMDVRFDALDKKLQTLIDDQKAYGRRVQTLDEQLDE